MGRRRQENFLRLSSYPSYRSTRSIPVLSSTQSTSINALTFLQLQLMPPASLVGLLSFLAVLSTTDLLLWLGLSSSPMAASLPLRAWTSAGVLAFVVTLLAILSPRPSFILKHWLKWQLNYIMLVVFR